MRLASALCALALYGAPAFAQEASLTIDGGRTGPRLSPLLHGIFFEEINHAGDGGLNPEKLRGTDGWEPFGKARTRVESSTGKPIAVTVAAGAPGDSGGVVTDGY